MKTRNVLLLLVITVCIGVAGYSMRGMLTPYVGFRDAISSRDYVQVIGTLSPSVPVEHSEKYFTFTMKDKDGTSMKVRHAGAKPLNFEHAKNIVALGSYNAESGIFEAEKLLIKCPSKYQKEKTK